MTPSSSIIVGNSVDDSCLFKDNEPSTAYEITNEPYLPRDRKNDKNSGKIYTMNQKLLNFNKIFANENWARYMQSTVCQVLFQLLN